MASSLASPHVDPFAQSTDPGLFVATLGHADCLARLRQAIRRGPGLALVTGGAGSGKTILAAALVRDLAAERAAGEARDGDAFLVGTIPDPTLCRTDVQFLRAILDQFGVPTGGGRTGLDLLTRFQRALAGDTGDGVPATLTGTPLLVIDDAASLVGSHFEILRALLAFGDVAGPRGPRIVLFGRPELTDKVGRKRNLASRVTMSHALNPINEEDTAALLAHRITVAGGGVGNGSLPRFAPAAVVAIAERAGAVPAEILRAASATMDLALRSGRGVIEASTVAAALPAPEANMDLVLSGPGAASTPPIAGALQTRLAFVVPAGLDGAAPDMGGAR